MRQASPAMEWANKHDKDAVENAPLTSNAIGGGLGVSTMQKGNRSHGHSEHTNGPIPFDAKLIIGFPLAIPRYRPNNPFTPELESSPVMPS
ncbi:hypothetical protein QIS74_01332 [Colletotrichum tabaci]|uniref:Uncharacterized protein n=1 Tax=Colletotrichum tabaci TaxID=1209068 RepID=A0AAV9TQF3_9PEZI